MTLRNQKGDSVTPQRRATAAPGAPSQQLKMAEKTTAPFAVMSVELPPGLPRVNNSVFDDLSPPAHIPFSGWKQSSGSNNSGKKNQRKSTPRKQENSSASRQGTIPNPNLKFFQLVSPLPFATNSVPIRGIKTDQGVVKYPLLLCSQEGTVMVSMAAGIIVELCMDRSFRVVCNTDFMAYINSNGAVCSFLHKYAKIVHQKEHVHCKFLNTNDRMAVMGPEGILFSMDSLTEAYLLSGAKESGPSAVVLEKPEFPIMNMDYTIQQMYGESDLGASNMEKCEAVMQQAQYEKHPDGLLTVHINGMLLKYNTQSGEVNVEAKPVKLTVNATTLTAQLRSAFIDMAIQDKDKCYVKRGEKRIHTSRSGMVISDGTCTISMDQFGCILSCS